MLNDVFNVSETIKTHIKLEMVHFDFYLPFYFCRCVYGEKQVEDKYSIENKTSI